MKNNKPKQVQQHILRQIERDKIELARLMPNLDWYERVLERSKEFIPRIVTSAKPLMRHVEASLNSPLVVRDIWQRVKEKIKDDNLTAEMDDALKREHMLLSVITGETISKLIADFLCGLYPDLAQNNRSTYPDLYSSKADYSGLPSRAGGEAKGPALKGNKPTSVPDGIEIKSNRGLKIRVDCHYNHQGLHLALTFGHDEGRWSVHDVYLAYLSGADYRRSARNTDASTDKFSFGHAPFISVTTGEVEEGLLEKVTD